MTLLEKIIKSGISENKTIRRLSDLSYSSINGQRQEVKNYQPEGVVMMGQLNNVKPLQAITREMILDFQEKEKAPIMVDGEARVYAKPDFEPFLQIPTDTEDIKDEAIIIMKNRILTARNLKEAVGTYKLLTDAKKSLERDINTFGLTKEKKDALINYDKDMANYLKEINLLRQDYERYSIEMKNRQDLIKNIEKDNSLISKQNREEVLQYETELGKVNRHRLNLKQQPYESDVDYYRRLKEVEQTKYDPILYKQRALNENIKELKPKLSNIFKDPSFIEDVLKTLDDEDKYKVNKYFDDIEKSFISKYGYNPSMSVKQASQELPSILDELNLKASILQGAIRGKQTEKMPDTNAIKSLQAVIKRNKIQKRFEPVLKKSRRLNGAAETLQNAIRAKRARKEYFDEIYEKEKEAEFLAREEERNKLMEENIANSQKRAEKIAKGREIIKERFKAKREAEARENLEEQRQEYIRGQKLKDKGEEAANLINRIYRGHLGRKDYEYFKTLPETYAKRREQISSMEALTDLQQKLRESKPNPYYIDVEKKKENIKKLYENLIKDKPLSTSLQTGTNERDKAISYLASKIKATAERERVLKNYQIMKDFEAVKNREYPQITEEDFSTGAISESPEESEGLLSGLSTIPQGTLNPYRRTDIGIPRGTYEKEKRAELKRIAKEQKAEEKKSLREALKEEGQAKRTPKKKGEGFNKIVKKRIINIKPEEKLKNRLRLVASQIEAGNTNPKLIIEVNKLYKEIYDIDNAYQYLKLKLK